MHFVGATHSSPDSQKDDKAAKSNFMRNTMKSLLKIVLRVSITTQVIAGVTLALMLLLTISEVILRAFGKPIVGSYEIISFMGGLVIGFAIPYTSWVRGHVYVDFLVNWFSMKNRRIVHAITRCMGILLFLLIGWNFVSMGLDLQTTKQVSMTLRLPYYPIAYGIGLSCFIQCVLLFSDILKIRRGEYD